MESCMRLKHSANNDSLEIFFLRTFEKTSKRFTSWKQPWVLHFRRPELVCTSHLLSFTTFPLLDLTHLAPQPQCGEQEEANASADSPSIVRPSGAEEAGVPIMPRGYDCNRR